MSGNIRFPNITGGTDTAKLVQIQSYLHQLVQELNYSLANIEAGGNGKVLMTGSAGGTTDAEKKEDARATFNAIKALIIKSADVVNAYYDVISKRLEGVYVAESDFGTYAEQTAQDIKANSTSITSLYTNVQSISTDIKDVEDMLVEVNARIKSGLLYYDEDGLPVYGLEIGQRTKFDDVEIFNKYARFTSDRLSFYDQNDNEVAYISDKKLYITHIQVTGSYQMSEFVDTVLGDGSIVTRWIGHGGDE